MPIGVLGSGLTAGNLKELNNQYTAEDSEIGGHADMKSVGSMASSIWLPRPKVETPEERVDRKLRVKEYKRVSFLNDKLKTLTIKFKTKNLFGPPCRSVDWRGRPTQRRSKKRRSVK